MRRVVNVAGNVLASALLLLILAAVAIVVVIPKATHGAALTVLSGSMTPDIPVGSVVVDRPVDPGTLHVGDIATYQKAPGVNEYITHRIIKIDASKTPTMFTFKGDANRGPDIAPVPATAIRGKVWFHVPYLGSFRDAIHTKRGVGAIATILLAIYALFQLGSWFGDRRKSAGSSMDAPAAGVTPASAGTWRVHHESVDDEGEVTQPLTLVATLAISDFGGLDAQTICRLLNADLIEADDTTLTVRITDGGVRRLRRPAMAGR
jgi:signal peptidase